MARNYRHIQQYEKEILELKERGLTHREIGENLGFTQIQVKEFFHTVRKIYQFLREKFEFAAFVW